MYKLIFIVALAFGSMSIYSSANKLTVGDFSKKNLSGWDEKSFTISTYI